MGLGTSPISRVGATADWTLSRLRRRSFIPSELLIRAAAANPLKNVLRFPHFFGFDDRNRVSVFRHSERVEAHNEK